MDGGILANLIEQTTQTLSYDPAYVKLDYPNGDLSVERGVCADVVVRAFRKGDIGLLYVMGVNGQLLMHFAALRGYEWNAYLEAMREGERKYGPVRGGLYGRASDRK